MSTPAYFHTPECEYKASRLTQMMESQGYRHVFASKSGTVMVNIEGHMTLIDLNELGQPYMVDKADVVRRNPPNVFTIE